jgi:hypothetical protein
MAKTRRGLRGAGSTDSLVEEIVGDVRFDRADALAMIGIPSHTQSNKALPAGAQSKWATAAMRLFADLFGGATALHSHKGIYKSLNSGDYLWDDTILIESFTPPNVLQDEQIVAEVVAFARNMRRDLDQEAVFVVFNNVVRFVGEAR